MVLTPIHTGSYVATTDTTSWLRTISSADHIELVSNWFETGSNRVRCDEMQAILCFVCSRNVSTASMMMVV